MRLVDLDAEFCRWADVAMPGPAHQLVTGRQRTMATGMPFAQAQGIRFKCPCAGRHWQVLSFDGRGLEDHQGSQVRKGGPSRWVATGTCIDDLTLTPSIDTTCWSGHVAAGQATTP